MRAWRSCATRSATERACGSRSSPNTSVAPGFTAASFSSAMSVTVGPSQRVCSSPTLVRTVIADSITLVAS